MCRFGTDHDRPDGLGLRRCRVAITWQRRDNPVTLEISRQSAAGQISSGTSDLDVFERLDQVTGLEILEVGQADTAFEALTDLAGDRP